ncbi:MAG TPA: sulfatase-like hydrolase/transferase [Myxococcota bacterium]|nr:sulfatase-like hydrolase/transferase [Myxococcota bacterium]
MAIHRSLVRAVSRNGGSRAWWWLFATSLVVLGVADAVVLHLTKAYFGSGYNGFALTGLGQRATFFATGALLDLTLLAATWGLVAGVARLVRARPLRALAGAAALGLALPLAFDLTMHRLHRVLGDVLELRLLIDLAGGSWGSALGEAAQDLPPLALIALLAGLASSVLGFIVLRVERANLGLAAARLPRGGALAIASGVGLLAGALLLGVAASRAPALNFGLSAKPSGRAIAAVVSSITDVDRDGFGLLSVPSDPAPFDGAIHPWAIDRPGNGIDEDGVAGDLPTEFVPPAPVEVPRAVPRAGSPSVVLILLEGFRPDIIGLRVRGREVTPNLARLAATGMQKVAYAHVPATWASRGSLLQGRVVPTPEGDTLVDDFLARGYEVGWFSGQHDGSELARLGTERATRFSDARADLERRTSRSAQPISLQVSWKAVNARVTEFLSTRSSRSPLFLYVNLVDTHFPYWHRELDDLLSVGELPRNEIRAENRARVWQAYLNAAANVDRAIGELLTQIDGELGPGTLIVVTADHGEAFYEAAFLGHGQALDTIQTAVPLIVRGGGAELPDPVALSDLRGLIGSWLDGSSPTQLERTEISQWLGELARPRSVALRTRTGPRIVDLASPLPEGGLSEIERRAVWAWEASRAATK